MFGLWPTGDDAYLSDLLLSDWNGSLIRDVFGSLHRAETGALSDHGQPFTLTALGDLKQSIFPSRMLTVAYNKERAYEIHSGTGPDGHVAC